MTVLVDFPAIPQSSRLVGPPSKMVSQCCDHETSVVFSSPSLGNVCPGLQERRMSTNWPLELVRTKVEVGSSSLGSSGS